MTRHLASALVLGTGRRKLTGNSPAGGNTGRLFLMFGGPVCADRLNYCPLDMVLTLITLNLKI